MGPARTVGPTEWRRNSNEVTAPKLPPPTPPPSVRPRDSEGRAWTLSYSALTAAQATRAAARRCVGTEARRARAPLRAHVCGPGSLQGLPGARRVGSALARDRPREPRPL